MLIRSEASRKRLVFNHSILGESSAVIWIRVKAEHVTQAFLTLDQQNVLSYHFLQSMTWAMYRAK